jgi:hypothetical protein
MHLLLCFLRLKLIPTTQKQSKDFDFGHMKFQVYYKSLCHWVIHYTNIML